MKKIVFFTEKMTQVGGVNKVISLWSNYFIKNYNVEIVSEEKGNSYFELDKKIIINNKKFKFNKSIFDILNNFFIINKMVKKETEAIYIINKFMYVFPFYLIKKINKLNNIKLVYFSHGGNSDFENFYMKKKIGRFLVKLIFETFDKVICLYKDTEKTPNVVKDEKIVYIKNPVTFKILDEKEITKSKTILYVGRIAKEKGIDTLIKAWNLICYKNDYKLLIVGDGLEKNNLEKLAKELEMPKDKIEFKNGTSNVLPYYQEAEIFVLPSLFEGMPLVLIEAKSQRVATISTKTSGGKKMIDHMKTGLLVEISHIEDLADKLEKLIYDKKLREEIIKNSIEQLSEFKIEEIAKNWNIILGENKNEKKS